VPPVIAAKNSNWGLHGLEILLHRRIIWVRRISPFVHKGEDVLGKGLGKILLLWRDQCVSLKRIGRLNRDMVHHGKSRFPLLWRQI
jgi:hypothetical protein